MRIAVTGATGFLGRFIVEQLAGAGHDCRCWHRPSSDRGGFEAIGGRLEWVEGALDGPGGEDELVEGCDAMIHAALDRPGDGFIGGEGDLLPFAEANLLGSLRLFEAARRAELDRIVFISTCAVYDEILPDRPLDEAHPLRPGSHYGAHKAAVEAFVHSFGRSGLPICALRPTGIYGPARPIDHSKWYGLVRDLAEGRAVRCNNGGKEVHAADVARAADLLVNAPADAIIGRAFNCYDRYVSEFDVATIARGAGASGTILGDQTRPKHQIETGLLRSMGMAFGGEALLESYVRTLLEAVR